MLLLVLVTVVATALRLYGLGEQPLWLDEATTADYAESGLVGSVFAEPPNPPLFYVVEYVVVGWLGATEWALRLPAAVFGILAVPAAWAVARKLFPEPRSTAQATAAVAAVSPFLIYLSQEARSYSLVILLTLLSTVFFLRFCNQQRGLAGQGKDLVIYAVLSTLLMYSHYYGAWVLLAHEAVYWLHVRARKMEWVLTRVNVALAFLPWAIWAAPGIGLGSVAWVGSALVRAPYTLLRDLVGYGVAPQVISGQPVDVILREEGWAVALTVAPLLWLLGRGAWWVLRAPAMLAAETGERGVTAAASGTAAAARRTLLVTLLVVPIAVLVAVSPWAKLLHERAVSFQSPFVVMLLAYGWATLRLRGRVLAGLAGGAAMAFALAAYYGAPGELLGYRLQYGKENWRAVAAHIDQMQPDVVIVQPDYLHLALKRYWREPAEVVRLKDGPRAEAAERTAFARLAAKRRVVLVIAWGGPAEQRLREGFARGRRLADEKYFPIQGGLRVVTYDRGPHGAEQSPL
jgi:4-amino-4-deoxy-L-arabinose transferase-like glycosyltransferase